MGVAISHVEVFIGAVAVEKGSADAHLHDVLTETLQKVDCARHTRVLTESDQPVSVLISDLFVVDEANIAFQDCIERSHVVELTLTKIDSTLMTCGKYIKVLSAISFSGGTSLIPSTSEQGLKSSCSEAPAASYSWSEKMRFLEGCTINDIYG